jgi:hypothetical protein
LRSIPTLTFSLRARSTKSGHATLSGSAEGRPQHGVQGRLAVGVGHDDAVVLRAHHGLAALAGRRGAFVDVRAHSRGADEGNGLDVGVIAKRVGGFRSTMHDVEHSRRQAGFEGQLRDHQGSGGVLLGGLEHKGIADRDGHREHPAGQHHGEIERRNAGADAQRLNDGVHVDARRGVLGELPELQGIDRNGMFDGLDAPADFALGIRQRLAMFMRQRLGDPGRVLAQQTRQVDHDLLALGLADVAPGLEGFGGIGYGVVEFLGRRERHPGDDLLGRRIDDVAPFLGFGLDQFPADQ